MKKIVLLLITLFIALTGVSAKESFYLGGKVNDLHINMYKGSNKYNGYLYQYRRSDGKLVYCIEPFKLINTKNSYDVYNYNDKKFNLNSDILNRINLIAYYGYNYNNHTDLKWYAATQFLIWQSFGLDGIYFDDPYTLNKTNDLTNEIKEIENLVNKYNVLPSFANKTLQYSTNKTFKLVDENNVLNSYQILSSDIDVTIDNNVMNINTKEDGIYKIKFIKKSPIDNEYLLYYLDGAQSLIAPGKINDINFELTIEVDGGSITINKVDSENKNRLEATLKGAIYGLYDSKDNLIEKLVTDEKGIAYIKDLPLGLYKIRELQPSKGYILDENIYEINITKDTKDFTILSNESIIKGKLKINKYYGGDNNYRIENNATFEIYDSSNNLVGTYKTKNGVIELNLPYGKYTVKQVGGINGYKYVKDFDIFIGEEKTYEYTLRNEIIKGKLKINKYYGEEDNYKLEDDAVFEIYDFNNNLVGTYKTKNGILNVELKYGRYKVVQKKGIEGYELSNSFDLFVGEEKEYSYNLYNKKIYGTVTIKKYYGGSTLEDGATFKISNNENVFYVTTLNGIATIKLPYGNYRVEQLTGKYGYKNIEPFNISITESKNYLYELNDDIMIVEVPDTGIYRKKNNSYIFITISGVIILLYSIIKRAIFQ